MTSALVISSTLTCVDKNNARGQTTWEFKRPNGAQLSIYFRSGGTRSGKHFHKGEDSSKDPEYIILLDGKISFHVVDIHGASESKKFTAWKDEDPIVIEVRPELLHWIEFLSDTLYVEPRTTHFNPLNPDTFAVEKWDEFVKQNKK